MEASLWDASSHSDPLAACDLREVPEGHSTISTIHAVHNQQLPTQYKKQ